ncbi:MAG: PfkB family carbohydrate kinase [Candidatus Omnitrophota bacterium]
MSIVVLGTVALDTVKTPFGKRKNILGGSAAHFAMSARLFTQVHLVAVIGKDFPVRHVDFLRRKGLDLASLAKEKGESFRWDGEYQGDLNCAITNDTKLGVLSDFKPRLSKEQRKIKNIFLANIDPEVQSYFLGRMQSPRLVGLDSMNFWIKHKRKSLLRLLKKVNIYVANDQEARDLSGENNLVRAASFLHKLGPQIVLIKKGEHGVLLYSGKFIFALPAYPMSRVVDPTGAGDTFAGGFMGYLAKTKKINEASIKKAISYGTIAASFNIEDFGLKKTSRLTLEDLERRLVIFKKYVLL